MLKCNIDLQDRGSKIRVGELGKREETIVLYCCPVSLVKCDGECMTLTEDK